MNDAVIIQQVYAGSACTELIALTLERNLNYAKAHGFDYQFYYGDIVPEWNPKEGGWAKLMLIHNALSNGYKYVIWLDADTVIADLNADLRDGCPPDGIGAVEHHCPNSVMNVGVLYFTNSEGVRAFLNEWASWYPGPQFPGNWHENAVFNLYAQLPECVIHKIDSRWNSCKVGNCHVENAAVEGFHGEGDTAHRLELMKAFLEAL